MTASAGPAFRRHTTGSQESDRNDPRPKDRRAPPRQTTSTAPCSTTTSAPGPVLGARRMVGAGRDRHPEALVARREAVGDGETPASSISIGPALPVAPSGQAGGMFWLRRNRLVGSYRRLISREPLPGRPRGRRRGRAPRPRRSRKFDVRAVSSPRRLVGQRSSPRPRAPAAARVASIERGDVRP